MYAKFHIAVVVRKYVANPNEKTMYKYLVLFKLLTKSLVIGSISPTLQHNINSSWQAFIKRHAIMLTEIGIH